jgi:hypothetical protein
MSDLTNIFGGAFDAEAQDAPQSFEPFPVGTYAFEISDAEVKDTSSGTGKYLKTELTVIGPEYVGRKVFANFNLQNASAEAERIGREQFGALCRAIGKPKVGDANELIGGQFQAKVKIRPARDNYNAQNEIEPASCQPLTGAAASKPAAQPAARAAAPASSTKAPPWAKGARA